MTSEERKNIAFMAECLARLSVDKPEISTDDTIRLFGISNEFELTDGVSVPEITYQDILDDWRVNYPDLSPLLKDYRPALDEYMSIIIWTDKYSYLYSYLTKQLRKIAR